MLIILIGKQSPVKTEHGEYIILLLLKQTTGGVVQYPDNCI